MKSQEIKYLVYISIALIVIFVFIGICILFYHKKKTNIDENWISSNYPNGLSKRQVLDNLKEDKIFYSEDSKQNIVVAMFRDVSGSLILRSIQATFYFDKNNRLNKRSFQDFLTGP